MMTKTKSFWGRSAKSGVVCCISNLAGFGAARTIEKPELIPFLFFAFAGLICVLISFNFFED